MKLLDLPQNNIAEVTLIGTGGGYGESVVVHLGNQNWIVIDSCINPTTNSCLPLEYLKKIGVNVSKDVKLILCTHWHDDHLQGISTLFEESKNAIFCIARANDRTKFLRLVKLDYQKITKEASNSSTIEFNRCLDIIESRNSTLKLAQENTTLLSYPLTNGVKVEVLSLSPSDYTILEFDKEISTLITEFGVVNKKIISKSPNAKSVVLYLKLGTHRALLGSDLEVSQNPKEGWLNIIENNTVIDQKSTLFKIPHHGSENGYHEKIWITLLEKNPVSKLTPWNKNQKLPEAEMLKKFCVHSDSVYMTAPQINKKPKKRAKDIEKIITRLKSRISEVKYKQGIIRSRIDMITPSKNWEIDLFDEAFHVNTII